MDMDANEIQLLKQLDDLLKLPSVAVALNDIADRIEKNFLRSFEPLAWEDVPLEVYLNRLPDQIHSSWVFLLRADSNSGAERHPNSIQRVTAWRGAADFQVWIDDQWKSQLLVPDFNRPIEDRWVTIPVNTWHQAVVGPGNHWIVVSFHTASAEELIEERPNPADATKFHQRLYKLL
jgi:hypothetical protein